jgi:hypothetical protein
MTAETPAYRRLIAGAGGVSLMLAVFLPWAGVQGVNRTGWDFNGAAGVLLLIAGVFGVATAITGGQFGAGRPDVSIIGATDWLNVTATLVLAWLIFGGFPEHATHQPGIFVALISTAAIACAVADYRAAHQNKRATYCELNPRRGIVATCGSGVFRPVHWGVAVVWRPPFAPAARRWSSAPPRRAGQLANFIANARFAKVVDNHRQGRGCCQFSSAASSFARRAVMVARSSGLVEAVRRRATVRSE